jgi:hypothetical protein
MASPGDTFHHMKSKLSPAHEHPRVTAKRAEIVAAEARLQQAIRREKAARARLRERLPVVQSGDLKEGEILWSWSAHKHFDELGFDPAKTILFRRPGSQEAGKRKRGRLAPYQFGILDRPESAFRCERCSLSS